MPTLAIDTAIYSPSIDGAHPLFFLLGQNNLSTSKIADLKKYKILDYVTAYSLYSIASLKLVHITTGKTQLKELCFVSYSCLCLFHWSRSKLITTWAAEILKSIKVSWKQIGAQYLLFFSNPSVCTLSHKHLLVLLFVLRDEHRLKIYTWVIFVNLMVWLTFSFSCRSLTHILLYTWGDFRPLLLMFEISSWSH